MLALRNHQSRRTFAHITQVLGSSFVDIELSMDERENPPVLQSIYKTTDSAAVTLQLIKDMGKFTYRAMPLTESTGGLHRGQQVLPTSISLPADFSKLQGRSINVVGEPVDGKGDLDSELQIPFNSPAPLGTFFCPMYQLYTGIKAIDLLCPFSVGGKNGIVGFPGKTTLMHHLVDSLEYDFAVYSAIGSRTNEITSFLEEKNCDKLVVVNCGMGEPVGARARTAETSALLCHAANNAQRVFLFMDDMTRFEEALEEVGAAKNTIPRFQESHLSNGRVTSIQCMTRDTKELMGAFDSTLVLSRTQSLRGFFPAVDPFASQSSLMDSTFLGERHVECANAVVSILHRERELMEFVKTTGMTDDFTEESKLVLLRGRKIAKYLTQDLEIQCDLEQTIQDCEDILAGKYDHLPEQAFFMIGNMPQQLQEEEEDLVEV